MYKKLFLLASAATLLAWFGCSGSNWWAKAAEFGFFATGTLNNLGIVKGAGL